MDKSDIESAWPKYPDYRIEMFPSRGTARVWHGDLLLAESDRAMRLEETRHVDRLYFPEADVRWELFTKSDTHTICPFKGYCDYWSLTAADDPLPDVVWTYLDPFDEVAGIKGYVCFYQERVRVEIVESWGTAESPAGATYAFPTWGDASDLVELIDVQPVTGLHYQGPGYRVKTRNVVEGGQILAEAIVAASKAIPNQRVTWASMVFSKAASFDDPLDIHLDVVKPGKTFSTLHVRVDQAESLRSAGLILMDAGAPDAYRHSAEMPDVAGPSESKHHTFGVTGRDIRVVDGAYDPDPDRVGPPAIYTWVRFRDAPSEHYLHTALMAQSTTHWTIAASMLPHKGFGERDTHVTLSTGVMAIGLAVHDEIDVSEWLLYVNPSTFAGRGLVQGEGRVFTQAGKLVASYSCQAMVRAFNRPPEAFGMDHTNAM